MHLDGDESVEILMNGECVLKVNVSRWQHVYGIVDLYGKAEAVTVVCEYSKKKEAGRIVHATVYTNLCVEKRGPKELDTICLTTNSSLF